jgi:hypothetical protein
MDKTKLKQLIDEIVDNCPNKNGYCTIKEILLHVGQEPRTLIQIKLIEKFKFEKSRELSKDIGWDGAFKDWIELKYAQKFSKLYDEEKSVSQLYKEIMNKE